MGRWRAGGLAVLVLFFAAWLRTRLRPLPQWPRPPTTTQQSFGGLHVHTCCSHDSRSQPAALAAAAAAAGLQFLLFTDHDRRQLNLPERLAGVRLAAGIELSTACGHLLTPQEFAPLSRAARRAPDLVAQLRARGIATWLAHPSDRKRPWQGSGACGRGGQPAGVEVANTAAMLRRHGLRLLAALPFALFAPRWAMAQLYDRDDAALARLDVEADAKVVAICGLDAHGWLPPSLELLPWQMGVPASAPTPWAALVKGRSFCSAGLLGQPHGFDFFATKKGGGRLETGEAFAAAGVAGLEAKLPRLRGAPQGWVVLRDGRPWRDGVGPRLWLPRPPPGTYRLQIWARLPGLWWGSRRVPVIYSNRLQLLPTGGSGA